jgi:hypothetical protein
MYAAGRPILKRLAEDDGIFWDSDWSGPKESIHLIRSCI